MEDQQYAGFFIRVGAAIVDTIILLVLTLPILFLIYGGDYWTDESIVQGTWDLLLSYIFPAVAVIAFWLYKSATPGKMLTSMKIVDAKTGNPPGLGQCIIRYIGYFVAMIPFFIGILWILFDKRKQGWHDKIAGTLVVRTTDEL